MDKKAHNRIKLERLYEMFRDRVEENVIYIVFSENEGEIELTIDQLMSIASCSFTGHHFESKPMLIQSFSSNLVANPKPLGKPSTKVASQCNGPPSGESHNEADKSSITDEDDEELSIDERINRLQKYIDELTVERKSSQYKASQYLSKKMYPVTSYYSELGSQINKMIELKTNKLVDLLLQKSENSSQIDLHGLNPVQARLVVNELLKTRQHKLLIDKQDKTSVDIITGWGKHSVTNGHRIRPTIVGLLKELGFEYSRLNRGALRVTIRND